MNDRVYDVIRVNGIEVCGSQVERELGLLLSRSDFTNVTPCA